jgi:hypothetical protein
MRTWKIAALSVCAGLAAVAACSAGSEQGSSFAGTGGSGTGGIGPGLGGGGNTMDVGVAGGGPCDAKDDQDHDGDGYSWLQGDCNDCDPMANPGAYDVLGGMDGGPGLDEDCSGTADDEPTDCDANILLHDKDAMNAARALGLCRVNVDPNATGKDKTWGVVSARYVKADGTDGMSVLSHGILPGFGAAHVQQGASMLALSSGTARAPGQMGWQSPKGAVMGTQSEPPLGFPIESAACPGVLTGACKDPAALELQVRVPTNARSLRFLFNFYTYEFPEYICSQFNDYFVTLMDPPPPDAVQKNISFDTQKNPISVNNALLQVCKPQLAPPNGSPQKSYECPLGTGLLAGTGYDDLSSSGPHAATGWLVTQAPVTPGSLITLRFAIWDSGDGSLDSTVLIDGFEWSVEPATQPITVPVQNPK